MDRTISVDDEDRTVRDKAEGEEKKDVQRALLSAAARKRPGNHCQDSQTDVSSCRHRQEGNMYKKLLTDTLRQCSHLP